MRRYPDCGLQLSALQLVSNALIAVGWCALDATVLSAGAFDLSALHEPAVLGGVLYTGLISTALTVVLQTRALGMLPATDSSVIVATEPLWAAGFAAVSACRAPLDTRHSITVLSGGTILARSSLGSKSSPNAADRSASSLLGTAVAGITVCLLCVNSRWKEGGTPNSL